MNTTHVIRIRGPWQRLVVSGGGGLRETVRMPSSWDADLGPEFQGRVEYRRFFHRPTNLDGSTRILLAFENVVGHAVVSLNGHELGGIAWPQVSGKFDVAGKLAARNELTVLISAVSVEEQAKMRAAGKSMPAGGLVGDVRLEIG